MIEHLTASTQDAILNRINSITQEQQPQWGKMTAPEVMKHMRLGLEAPMQKLDLGKANPVVKLMWGKKIKNAITNDELYGKNLPTAPAFDIHGKDPKVNFESEREKLHKTIGDFVNYDNSKLEEFKHPLFGKMTADEWRKSQWKHLNHHLMQFGV